MEVTVKGEVFDAILQERRYQDGLGSARVNGHVHTVGEELTLLKVYVDRALLDWVDNAGDEVALHVVRKIAAIAVRCMENHGAPKRG